MNEILQKLKCGDRRSIGRAHEVVQDVLQDPDLFDTVFGGMLHHDPLVRMRAADVVEKVTAVQARGRLALQRAGLLAQLNSQ